MKKLILLLNVALILLCGCKGKSFMAQRYTNLGHSPHKHSTNETRVVKNKIIPTADYAMPHEKVKESGERLLCSNAPSLKETTPYKPSSISISQNKVSDPFLHKGAATVSSLKAAIEKSKPGTTQLNKTKKTFRERVHAASGLLNTALKIVLFVVILAVLVAVIIIILIA